MVKLQQKALGEFAWRSPWLPVTEQAAFTQAKALRQAAPEMQVRVVPAEGARALDLRV